MKPITCSVDEAVAALGIGRSTFYRHMRAGLIETVRLGGRRLVKIDSLRNVGSGK